MSLRSVRGTLEVIETEDAYFVLNFRVVFFLRNLLNWFLCLGYLRYLSQFRRLRNIVDIFSEAFFLS